MAFHSFKNTSSKNGLNLLLAITCLAFIATLTTAFIQDQKETTETLIPVRVIGQIDGYVNLNGDLVIPAVHYDAHPFSEGLATVGVTKKETNGNGDPMNFTQYGCINAKGKMVIKPKFTFIQKFENGLALARKGKYMGLINQKGKEVLPIEYEFGDLMPKRFTEGLVAAMRDEQYGFINQSGQWVIEPQFEEAEAFHNGTVRVKKEGLYGYIDKQGKTIIPFIYEYADPTLTSHTLVSKNRYVVEDYLYMDQKGNKQELNDRFLPASSMVEKAAWTRLKDSVKKVFCIMDSSLNLIKVTDYDKVGVFENGLARIEKNKKIGYVDTQGKEVVPPIYGFGLEFENDYTCVCANAKEPYKDLGTGCGIIDKQGQLLIDTLYTSPVRISENRFATCKFWDGQYQDVIYYDLLENKEVFRTSNR